MACTSLMEIRVPNAKAWAMVIPDDAMGYYKYERYGEKVKIPGVIICGQRNSPIQRYAEKNGFEFRAFETNLGSKTEHFSIVASGSVADPVKTDISPAAVTVTGKGNYTGSKAVNFTIVKAAENPGEKPDTSITCKKNVKKEECEKRRM